MRSHNLMNLSPTMSISTLSKQKVEYESTDKDCYLLTQDKIEIITKKWIDIECPTDTNDIIKMIGIIVGYATNCMLFV